MSKSQSQRVEEPKPAQKECFVIMPISDTEGYSLGHWPRVYDHLIAPACEKAGFRPVLASEVQLTNVIVLDILRRVISSDMVLCDLSSRNPNVLYELGIRQAFGRPVTLIKDDATPRIFDVQGLRDVEYDAAMRVDNVKLKIDEIASHIQNTANAKGDGNSMVTLLGIAAASLPSKQDISPETALILERIESIGSRISAIEEASDMRKISAKERRWGTTTIWNAQTKPSIVYFSQHGGPDMLAMLKSRFPIGSKWIHASYGIGVVSGYDPLGYVQLEFEEGSKQITEPYDELSPALEPGSL